MKKLTLILIGLMVLIGVVLIVSNTTQEKRTSIKLGVVAPFSGELAQYGNGFQKAVSLALKENKFERFTNVIFEDDESCDPKKAVSAITKLIEVNKVDAIIGSLCSSATLAMAPIAERNHTLLVSPSASAPTITTAGEYIFRLYVSDKEKSIFLAQFVVNKLEVKKAATLYDVSQDAFVQQRDDIRAAFLGLGGQIVVEQEYTKATKDFRTLLVRIKQSDPKAVFFGASPKDLGLILKQARELGLDARFMGADAITEDQEVINIAGSAAEGIVYTFHTTQDNPEVKTYQKSFKDVYGTEPPAYSAEAYDATMLVVKALQKANENKEKTKEELHKIGQKYQGASGEITFDKNGDVQKPFIIKTIRNGKFVPYE